MKKIKIKKATVFKTLAAALIAIVCCSYLCSGNEQNVKNKVVKLTNSFGSCSGEQVKAKSGTNYILTAGHCLLLEENGMITVHTEDGRAIQRRVIAEDINSDLLLLEGVPNLDGLSVADKSYKGEHVRTFTHGKGLDTYKTEGDLIQEGRVEFPMDLIESQDQTDACLAKPKNKIETFGPFVVCVYSKDEVATTAQIVPGSSGGPVVNSSDELVGVASATDGVFGYLVRIQDINAFLANY